MAPVIQRFLIEGSSRVAYAGKSAESLINYLDKNLVVLKEKLNETNFERILTVIWESSAQSLSDIIQLSIEVSHISLQYIDSKDSITTLRMYLCFKQYYYNNFVFVATKASKLL